MSFDHCEQSRIGNERNLYDFREPLENLLSRQRREQPWVYEYTRGWMKTAQEVLVVPEIDAALDTDSGVDLPQQSRRNTHVGNSAPYHRRCERDDVRAYAAPERDNRVATA